MAIYQAVLCAGLIALVGAPAQVFAEKVRADLDGYEEVPALSTSGHGGFLAMLDDAGGAIKYSLEYGDVVGDVLQAHIHFAQAGVNGGIMVFLCSNLGNGPEGTPLCPSAPGKVMGTVGPEGVVGPGAQGIGAGAFDQVLEAIRNHAAYVNVHTTAYPSGEIRGQVSTRQLYRPF